MSLDVYVGKGLFEANITHNLNVMAEKAGIYREVWRPEECGIVKARQLIEPLSKGIERLNANPAKFRKYEPENKWGTYDIFVPWLERYLAACKRHPGAKIRVSR